MEQTAAGDMAASQQRVVTRSRPRLKTPNDGGRQNNAVDCMRKLSSRPRGQLAGDDLQRPTNKDLHAAHLTTGP